MQHRSLKWLVVTVAMIALLGFTVAVGFSQQLGTKGHPIIWLLPPSTFPAEDQQIASQIAQQLSQITGLYIKPVVTPDYAALIESMVTAKGDTMACPTTNQYVQITKRNPQVHARLAAVRYGYPYYFTSIYVLRKSGFKSVKDLNGKTWIYPDVGSSSGYVVPKLYFDKLGIKPGKVVETGSHPASVMALLKGQGDFATGYGSPPLPPAGLASALKQSGYHWEYGMDPELWLWDRWNNKLVPEPLRGKCVDVRYAVSKGTKVFGSIWDIVKKVGILATIGPIPNDCLAFSAGFPKALEDELVQAVIKNIHSPEGLALWGNPKFYEWKDVKVIDDSFYDPFRDLLGYPIPKR